MHVLLGPGSGGGLRELHSALKPEGDILMFEHVRSGAGWLGPMMDLMNPVARLFGPDVNRRTAEDVRTAGFRITREYNVFLDMVKRFEGEKDRSLPDPARCI